MDKMNMKMVKHLRVDDLFVDSGECLQVMSKPQIVGGKAIVRSKRIPDGKRTVAREFVNPNRKVRLLDVGDSFVVA
jgi:hypothetical protein